MGRLFVEGVGGSGREVVLDCPSINHLLATVGAEDVRRQVYMAGYKGPASNMALLDHMISRCWTT